MSEPLRGLTAHNWSLNESLNSKIMRVSVGASMSWSRPSRHEDVV